MEALLEQVVLDRGQHAPRLSQHALAQLVCMGPHTITGLLSVCGEQFRDWSAHYRLYSRDRVNPERLFDVVRSQLCTCQSGPVVAALDDTRVRKTGRRIHGVKYTRDPLGPPFHVNFIRAQRFVQTCVAWHNGHGQARMIPVDWRHAPTPHKPRRNAPAREINVYQQQSAQARLGHVGVQRIGHLRRWMNTHGASERPLWVCVDGSFTNRSVFKQLPANTTLVGRIRRDAKLYHLPDEQPDKGRRRVYGEKTPTPEALRGDPSHPWRRITVFFGGQRRELRAKQLRPLRRRAAGQEHNLQLVVIAPTPYRCSPNGKILYRQPAYLICSDPDAPLHEVIQRYLWRWDIEVNFRDEKTLLGVGQAQVRGPAAVQNVTACAVAAYAMLLLAGEQCRAQGLPAQHLPPPKWRRNSICRASTMNLIQNLRYELWARSIHFSSFACTQPTHSKPLKKRPPLDSALFYTSTYS